MRLLSIRSDIGTFIRRLAYSFLPPTPTLQSLIFFWRSALNRAWVLRHQMGSSLVWRRPPFALWLGPASRLSRGLSSRPLLYHSPFVKDDTACTEGAAFFLIPDGLLSYFKAYAVTYGVALFIYALITNQSLLIASRDFLIVFFVVSVGIPYVLYGLLRVPLLAECFSRWPQPLNDWAFGIPSRCFMGQGVRIALHMTIVHNCLPFYHLTTTQASYWTRQNFQQQHYLNAAMSQLFYSGGDWLSPGFARWVTYYCAPVWSAYMVLIVFAVFTKVSPFFLASLSFVWWGISILFFLREIGRKEPTLLDSEQAKKLLPTSLWPHLQKYIIVKSAMPQWGVIVVNAISSIAFLAFLQLMSVDH